MTAGTFAGGAEPGAPRVGRSAGDVASPLRNAADAPLPANPKGPGRFRFIRRCRLLIGSSPNFVGSASAEAKSALGKATRITQTGSQRPPGIIKTGSPSQAAACGQTNYAGLLLSTDG